jgi:hypothetical protein
MADSERNSISDVNHKAGIAMMASAFERGVDQTSFDPEQSGIEFGEFIIEWGLVSF